MPNPRAQKNANLRSTATGVYDAVTQGLLPMIGNAARGSVAATLGAPGDLLGLLSDKQPLPTSQNILDYIPPVGSDKALTGMAETMGGFVPTPGSAGLLRAAKTVANPMTYGRAFMEAQAPAVMSPITAWHGSPHKFRKFDNSKMGTGEGAQAYGAGAYLADAREVAEGYQSALTGFNPMHIESDLVSKGISPETANTYAQFAAQTGGKKTSFENFKKSIQEKGPSPFIESYRQKIRSEFPKLEKAIEGQSGYLYKADIPDEAVANMLLWDKPLSEQPETVRNALNNLIQSKRSGEMFDPSGRGFPKRIGLNETTGESILKKLQSSVKGEVRAEDLLREYGIPGIRYLDAGSRGAGEGTMNTVVFDDSIIKILERNGVPLGLLAD